MKNLILIEKPISKNKNFCLQTSLFRLWLESEMRLDLQILSEQHMFRFFFNVFGLFKFTIDWSRKRDHAGFEISFDLIVLYFCFNIYDSRHWDDENDSWCVYEEIEKNQKPNFISPGISTRES